MKRHCDICKKKLGTIPLAADLKDGCVCRDCLVKAGLVDLLFGDGKNYTLEDIRKAHNAKPLISIDKEHQLFKIIHPANGRSLHSFLELLSYEVIEDDDIDCDGGYDMAAVGTVLFDPVGTAVGSRIGEEKREICNSLKIQLTLKGSKNKVEYLYFINTATEKESAKYKKAIAAMNECLSALEEIKNTK